MTIITKCQCGHPACQQYILSTQGSGGFCLPDARLYAAAVELWRKACHDYGGASIEARRLPAVVYAASSCRRQERENPMTDTPAHTPLPCPFCGSGHLTVCEIVGRGYTIECEGCHIEGPLAKDGPSLLERWNTRAALSQAGGASE